MNKEQESKYEADQNGDIFNRISGNYIPSDEPIMIFRARDKHAAAMIAYYKKLCTDINSFVILSIIIADELLVKLFFS